MRLSSVAFSDGGEIPKKYTQDGMDVSPPLAWDHVPPGTRSLALVVEDPDAPDPKAPKRTWVHWLVTNLPPDSHGLSEGVHVRRGKVGFNDWWHTSWNGPLPPKGRHRYVFKLYALDAPVKLEKPTKRALERAIQGHVLAESRLTGTYDRHAA
jgi:Raf kinase inhibitor-like YbhB/YbcL family protein